MWQYTIPIWIFITLLWILCRYLIWPSSLWWRSIMICHNIILYVWSFTMLTIHYHRVCACHGSERVSWRFRKFMNGISRGGVEPNSFLLQCQLFSKIIEIPKKKDWTPTPSDNISPNINYFIKKQHAMWKVHIRWENIIIPIIYSLKSNKCKISTSWVESKLSKHCKFNGTGAITAVIRNMHWRGDWL